MNEVQYIPIDDVIPYENNPRDNDAAVDAVAASIDEFGFQQPLVCDKDMVLVVGHTRLKAAKRLGYAQVPVVVASELTDEQVRAYRLADNKTAERATWDFDLLSDELDAITTIDMSQFDFNVLGASSDGLDSDGDDKYSQKITTPVYEVRGDEPDIHELYDAEMYDRLVSSIEEADIDDELRCFLMYAASRHIRFDYGKIAEFYAHQPREIQELMEDSTLVIIDFDKAVELGCVKAAVELDALREEDLSE